MNAFRRLEALNVDVCRVTGAGHGNATTQAALVAYDHVIASREIEFRAAIAAARDEVGRSIRRSFIDGVEGALNRAVASPRRLCA